MQRSSSKSSKGAVARTRFTSLPMSQKVLAITLSVVMVAGLNPAVPAWGDEVDTAADAAAGAAPVVNEPDATPSADGQAEKESTDASAALATLAETNEATTPTADAPAGDTATTPADAAPGTENTPAAGDDPAAGATPDSSSQVDQHFPADDKATAKLLKNLTKRFVEGGADAKMNDRLVNAAIALNSLDKGAKIDVKAIEKKMIAAEKKAKDGLAPGQYGRYIMMLTAAGIDCVEANINGTTRDLVKEMEKAAKKALKEGTLTVEDAVYMLPVYGNDGYTAGNNTIESDLLGVILAAQDESGFFRANDKAETYSTALSGQAMLALVPYMDVDEAVTQAVGTASEALYHSQMIEGGWPKDGIAQEGDVLATAYAVAALAAVGAVPNVDLVTSAGSTPIGWLTSKADKAMDGFTGIDKKDAVTAAAVLMALAANKGIIQDEAAFDVYDVNDVERPAEKTSTSKSTKKKTSSSAARANSETKTIPQSGDETSTAALMMLAALSAGAVAVARRRLLEA